MPPSAESLATNSAAVAVVVSALGSSVGLVALIFVGLYVAAALPFFFDETIAVEPLDRLPYFTSSTVIALLVGAVTGRLLAAFLGVLPGILTYTPPARPGDDEPHDATGPVRRFPFALFVILGVFGIFAGAAALTADGEVVARQSAVVAMVLGAIAFLGAGAGLVLVARDYATAYYMIAALVVAGVPAAAYDWLDTQSRLAAAAVAILLSLATVALFGGLGWFAERQFARHLAASATRYGVFWAAMFGLVALIYLVGAGSTDASGLDAADPQLAAVVARALFVAFWLVAALATCCFGALVCVRAGGRRRSGDEKRREADTESRARPAPTTPKRSRFAGI